MLYAHRTDCDGAQEKQASAAEKTVAVPVDLIIAHSFVELLDVLSELLGLLNQEVNINFVPQCGIPVCEGEHDSAHHIPQRLEVTQLLLNDCLFCQYIELKLLQC